MYCVQRLAEITGSRGFERYTGNQIMKISQTIPSEYKDTEVHSVDNVDTEVVYRHLDKKKQVQSVDNVDTETVYRHLDKKKQRYEV